MDGHLRIPSLRSLQINQEWMTPTHLQAAYIKSIGVDTTFVMSLDTCLILLPQWISHLHFKILFWGVALVTSVDLNVHSVEVIGYSVNC